MTFETFDQRDEETWPDQQKDNDKDNDIDNDIDNDKHGGDMTEPTKRQWQRQIQWTGKWQWQLKNTLKEQS